MYSANPYRLRTGENDVEGTQWGQVYPGFGPCCLSFHLYRPCHSVKSGSLSQQVPLFATDDNPLFCLPLLTASSLYLIINPWGVPGLDWGSSPGNICLQAPGWPLSQACSDNRHISAPAKQCGPQMSPSRGTQVLITWTRGRYGHVSTAPVLGRNNPKWYEHRVDPHCRNSKESSEAPPHRLSKRCPQAVCTAAGASYQRQREPLIL